MGKTMKSTNLRKKIKGHSLAGLMICSSLTPVSAT